MKRKIYYIPALFAFLCCLCTSCKKYLDIVPDNVATIEYAFRMRITTQKFLNTCYSQIPLLGDLSQGPAMMTGDELWFPSEPLDYSSAGWNIGKGMQNVNAPYLNYWGETEPATSRNRQLWRGIRDCNTFLENIYKVPDMEEWEKIQWAAEVKFLKAYYHFFLLTLYGPIPISRQNIPVDAAPDVVKVSRRPADSCFNYITGLLDEAIPDLPANVANENEELGRATRSIARSIKAKVLVYAASPLFNGNTDYQGFKNREGEALFNPVYDASKWEKAAAACREAIEDAATQGYQLYTFTPPSNLTFSPETLKKIELRNIITERWNREIIWANPGNNSAALQYRATPSGLDPAAAGNTIPRGDLGVPMKIAALYYTKNGLPINEDRTWNYNGRYNLKVAGTADAYYIKNGYTTAAFNFDREPRFYANLAFDGGIWEAQGKTSDTDPFFMQAKVGQAHGKQGPLKYSISGYWPKKYVHYSNVLTATTYTIRDYPWVLMRLGDLYLLYAEALNESNGPSDDVYHYLDLIRARAGLPPLRDAWTNYGTTPAKCTTKDGLRDIIHQERSIEMALEGQRFFDLRRWKEAPEAYNAPISGWDADQENPQAYYREKQYFMQQFSLRDYFWPIAQAEVIANKYLLQIPGW